MNIYDKVPNEANVKLSIMQNALNLNSKIKTFVTVLDSVDSATSICLDGDWGSGKTFFAKEIMLALNSKNICCQNKDVDIFRKLELDNLQKNYATLYFDAWENDNQQDPLLSLIYTLSKQFNLNYIFKDVDLKNITKNVALSIISNISKIDLTSLSAEKCITNLFDDIEKENNTKNLINEMFDKLAGENGDRVLIIIDELDRCRPDFAISLLEKIKHYMNNDNVTFLFCINMKELESVIKAYYGSDFSSTIYLDKFFDLRIALPKTSLDDYLKYLNIENNLRYYCNIIRKLIIEILHFEKREINKFLLLNSFYTKSNFELNLMNENEKGILFVQDIIIPLAIGLKIKDTNLYQNFINGKDSTPLENLLNSDKLSYYNKCLSTLEDIDYVEANTKDFYDSLFNKDFTGNIFAARVGNIIIDNYTRTFLYDKLTLISDDLFSTEN